jgi:histidinol-phosphatase (PHP family)
MGFLANYHTHTFRCKHASGDASDYAMIAEAGGCKVLGFSDHTPIPGGRWIEFRMHLDELDDYCAAVRAAAVSFPRLRILLGLECEWMPELDAFYREHLLGTIGCDYLVGASHLTAVEGGWINSFEGLVSPVHLAAYARQCVRTMESGLFAFLAHPDIFGSSGRTWSADCSACARDICAASAALGVPLEINGLGFRKPRIASHDGPRPPYPWAPFWQIAAEHGVQVVLNSDAHHPQDVLRNYEDVAALRDRYGLVEAELDLAPQRPA